MLINAPRNNAYLDLYGASARVVAAALAGATRGHRLEMFADFSMMAFDSGGADLLAFLGTYLGMGWFEYDAPAANTDSTAPVRFGIYRGSTDKYSGDGTITLGRRHALYGVDDQTNVMAWLDGTALGSATSQADWTPAQAARALAFTGDFYAGYDDSQNEYTPLRLYEFWVKLDGTVILHWRPKVDMVAADTSITLVDLSPLGNDGELAADKGRIVSAWSRNPAAFAGLESR